MEVDSPIHVLHVEDSPTDVLLTEEALSQASRFRLRSSDRLSQAIEILAESKFDVVLLDLGLPDSQGLNTLRTLKRKSSKVAVIVLTGKDDEEQALRALREGAEDYLVKGQTDAGQLRRAIQHTQERVTLAKKLRDSEERFQELTSHIDQVLWIIDAKEAKVLYVSPGYEKMWGRSCQNLMDNPRSFMQGIHPLDLEMMTRQSTAMFATGYIDVECRVLRPDDTVCWIWVRGYPVTETDNGIARLVGVIEDITEKKRLAAERDALLARLQLHIERLPLAYVLFDAQVRIIDWNPAAEHVFGYSKAEALGKKPFDLMPPALHGLGDELLRRARAGDMAAHSTNENLTKDGRTITCQWFNTPLLDNGGEFVGLLCLAQDVTQQKRLEEQYIQAQQRLRDVVASSPAVLFTLAFQNNEIKGISWISDNLRDVLGHEPADALHPDWWKTNVHPEDLERVIAKSDEEVIAHGHSSHEYRFRRADGDYRWTRGELRLIRDAGGRPVEIVGSWTDITERKSLEEQYHHAQKMEAFGQLAGGVAHDFNNLLTVINGYSELIQSRLPADDPVRGLVQEISHAGERAASLTRQLLAFSRKQVLEPKVLDLNDAVRETEKFLRRLIGEDIQLVAALDPTISQVKVDPGQLGQVLMNLAVNARDAMPKGGKLTIETRNTELDEEYAHSHPEVKPGPYVLLSMTDTGTGMTPEVQARIFEPFYTTKDVGKGTGLGLAVVLGVVKQSNGHLAVYSEPGVGTSFKVYFPPLTEKITSPSKILAGGGSRGTETILLVEDEDGVRGLAQFVLQNNGYTVLAADDAEAALQIVENHKGKIHLLMTDVVMPGISGPELAASLQTRFPNMKVLFSSGYTDDAVVRHGLLQEKVAFLQKPFTPVALARKVRAVLDEI